MRSGCGRCGICPRCAYLASRPPAEATPRRRQPAANPRRPDPRRVGLLVHVPQPMQQAVIAARLQDRRPWADIVQRSGVTESVCKRIVRRAA